MPARPRLAVVLTCALLSLGAIACGSDDTATPPPETPVDLSGKNFTLETGSTQVEVGALDNQFTPPYVLVKRGTTVTFENDGRNQHNVLPVVDGAFAPIEAEAFQPGATATATFDTTGDVPYYCSLHGTTSKGMVGAIRVVD